MSNVLPVPVLNSVTTGATSTVKSYIDSFCWLPSSAV